MKFSQLFIVASCVGLLASSFASAQIVNSKHNFSSYSWSGGEICKPCHTPHNANASAGALWNHELTNATYTMFGGGTATAAADFDARSRLCLSCHDGTVALDSFSGQNGTNYIPQFAKMGTDLSNDHPIGSAAVYPTMPSTRFKDPSTFPSTVRLRTWVDPTNTSKSVVSCGTCHNAHGRNFPNLLNISNAGSALCLTCHIK